MGSVRLKKANPVTLLLGGILGCFILYFLVWPSSSTVSRPRIPINSAHHALSPPTSPYKKLSSSDVAGPPPVTHYKLNHITTSATPIENQESVLVLTPMARFYQGYWDNLLKFDYPHELITLGFILPKTKEGDAATMALQAQIEKTQHGPMQTRFKSIIILRQDFEPAINSQLESERHKMENQKERRAVMAKARNSLLFTTLGPSTSWVLWLDSDIVESPPSLIQDLASHDKDVIVPNCYQRYYDEEQKRMSERAYDFNSWQDSDTAQQIGATMGPDEILLEGYAEMATYRSLMAYMVTGDDVHVEVPLDGVGGTALLVKADVHRDGAMFPPFAFYHLIETEGFAKMAKRLNKQPYGLPNYKASQHPHQTPLALTVAQIYHINE